jgi:hypothetical protein
MNLEDILSLCLTSKDFSNNICDNQYFWIEKLNKDFNVMYDKSFNSAKEQYINIIDKIILEYSFLVDIAKKFKNLKPNKKLVLPNGAKFNTNSVIRLFERWESQHKIIELFGPLKALELKNKIMGLMNL